MSETLKPRHRIVQSWLDGKLDTGGCIATLERALTAERERAERLMERLQQESERCDKEVSQRIWADTELQRERERADRNQEDAERWRAAELLFEAGYEMEDGSPAIALFLPEHWDPNEAIDAARRK